MPRNDQPEIRTCPIDGAEFEVGGRGRRRRDAVYCKIACANKARAGGRFVGSHAPRPRRQFRETLHDPEWLRARYEYEGLTLDQVADLAGSSKPSVWNALRKFGIARRTTSDYWPKTRRTRGVPRAGLTVDQYEMLLAEQGGVCAACHRPERKVHPRTGKAQRLSVDHRHSDSTIRGLLCSGCNYALGHAEDDPERLRALAAYVETRGR